MKREECKNKMRERVKEAQEQFQCELEWETGVQACIDTGNEWELWTIINSANG